MHRHTIARPAIKSAYITLLLAAFTLCLAPSLTRAQPQSFDEQAIAPAFTFYSPTGMTPQPVLEGAAIRLGAYPPDQKLRLVLGLQPRDPDGQEALLRELQDPASPNFHRYLTAEQWNARFAPTAEDEQRVVDWAVSQGITVTARFDNRLIVAVEAPAGVIAKAFGVAINSYRVGSAVEFSNDRDPLIAPALAGVLTGVIGMNSMQRPANPSGAEPGGDTGYLPGPFFSEGQQVHGETSSVRAKDTLNPRPALVSGYMGPDDIFSPQVYNFSTLQKLGVCCNPLSASDGSPKETTIAIVSAGGNFSTDDIRGFFGQFTAYSYNIQLTYVGGQPTCSSSFQCPGDYTTAEVEWAAAAGNNQGDYHNTAKVLDYIAAQATLPSLTAAYNKVATDNKARIFFTNWYCAELYGCPQATMNTDHAIFASMLAQGWTMVSTTGPNGSTADCDFNATAHYSVMFPASDPNFVAVGNTALTLNADGSFNSEVAWGNNTATHSCYNGGGGSGGGASAVYPLPSYQSGLSASVNKRFVPDLALNAVGPRQQIIYWNGALKIWKEPVFDPPEMAGFFAMENAYLLWLGNICGASGNAPCGPLGNPNTAMYKEGLHKNAPHFPFYDITAGCAKNDQNVAHNIQSYCATAGFDQVSGWGSANMLQLAWAINTELTAATGKPTIAFTGPATGKWYNDDEKIEWTVTDNSGVTGIPGAGLVGFTQGWDSVPADSATKAHGGTGDSFYAGPQFPFHSLGCLSMLGKRECSGGGVADGCHSVHIMAWNNQGRSSGDITYGPLCMDSTPPTVAFSHNVKAGNGSWYNKPVTVTITAADPGGSNASGVSAVYYGTDSKICTVANINACSKYSGPIAVSSGSATIAAFAVDKAGNIGAAASDTVQIDTTPPTTNATLAGTGQSGTYQSAVTVTLAATDGGSGVQSTTYSADGGASATYAAPFSVSAPGAHSVKYFSTDIAGNTEAAKTVSFTINSPTTTVLTPTPNPSAKGQSVALTAFVTATLGGSPAGAVTFYAGQTALGSAKVNKGVATISTSAFAAGVIQLSASFAGSGNFLNSVSATVSQAVALTPTSISLAASPGVVNWGKQVTLTATVTSNASYGALTGSVTFYDGTTSLGAVNIASGSAKLTTSALAAGVRTLTAAYNGDANYLPSTSKMVLVTVNALTAWVPDYYGQLLQVRIVDGLVPRAISVALPNCNPSAVAVNQDKAYVVCSAKGTNPDKILVYDAPTFRTASAGTLVLSPLLTITSSKFRTLQGIAFDSSNNLWVASYDGAELIQIAASDLTKSSPVVAERFANGPPAPVGLAFDKDGSLWVTGQYGGGILINYPASQLNAFGPKWAYCAASTDIGVSTCQKLNNAFSNPQGVTVFNGYVWVSNNSSGANGDTPGRQLVGLKYTAGASGKVGTLAVNTTYGSASSASSAPFVCPGALYSGSVHLWLNDGSYGESNPKCGNGGDAASHAGGVFFFTSAQLTAKPASASGVVTFTNISSRPGLGGIFVENDQ